jgi:putative transcriptional regulator
MTGRTTSLARHLLCAVPQLLDPNFKRSVVLMLEHNREGALGLVVNNELPNTVADVAEGLGLNWLGDPEEKVRLGGPVEPMRGWIVHDHVDWDPNAHEILPGVSLTTSLDPIDKELGVGGDGSHFLFLLGYAGWGAAQLEGEIAAGSWVAVPIAADDDDAGVPPEWLFDTPSDEMWDDALRSIGVDPGRLVGLKGGDAALH